MAQRKAYYVWHLSTADKHTLHAVPKYKGEEPGAVAVCGAEATEAYTPTDHRNCAGCLAGIAKDRKG